MHQPPMPTVVPSAHASAAALHARIGLLCNGHAKHASKHCRSHSILALVVLDKRVCSAAGSATRLGTTLGKFDGLRTGVC